MIRELNEAGFDVHVPRARKDYVTVAKNGECFRMRGSLYEENWVANSTPSLPNVSQRGPTRVADLTKSLEEKCRARAAYNLKRYGAAPDLPYSPPKVYDRTRTTPVADPQALGSSVSGARPAICDHAQRFGEAAQRWSRADGAVERAGNELGSATNLLEPVIDEARNRQQQQEVNDRLIESYGASVSAVTMNRHRGFEPELDMG